jgi:hypothetical protein
MFHFKIVSISLIFIFGLSNCEKKCHLDEIGGTVSFHLLKEHTLSGAGCAIDESAVTAEEESFIAYDRILGYDAERHVFVLDSIAVGWLKAQGQTLHQKAFAVMVDREIIYTCYFWYAWSSLSCDWYTTDPIMLDHYGGLKINSAYPGDPDPGEDDRRNDSRILCVLERDGKLE